jgi:hypothetical protein
MVLPRVIDSRVSDIFVACFHQRADGNTCHMTGGHQESEVNWFIRGTCLTRYNQM